MGAVSLRPRTRDGVDRLARSIRDLQDIVRTVRARGAVLMKATEQLVDPARTGFRVRRDGDPARLFTRRGCDCTARYPAIAITATLLYAFVVTCHSRGPIHVEPEPVDQNT
jgi:hypothetical protein